MASLSIHPLLPQHPFSGLLAGFFLFVIKLVYHFCQEDRGPHRVENGKICLFGRVIVFCPAEGQDLH
ncbi:MAG TPA: hypothetical protein PKU87_03535 [Candidatus Atribacteria bacterium]|nr:hypothetical protein [Candidatus Atribacteria bacterium]